MKIVIDDKIPYMRGRAERLADRVVYLPGGDISREGVRDADALIVRTRTRCDAALLEGSKVRLVVTATIGYDHLDTAWLGRAGIRWANCPGCNAASVRQYVHNALLVCALRHIHAEAADEATEREAWAAFRRARPTAGVVGVGHVGSLVADDLERLGFRVLRCDPPLGLPATMRQLAEECDILTFHPNLTTSGPHPSFHLADAAFFSQLRRRPLLLNASRGEVVDNEALVRALDAGQVGEAVVDTWEHEPRIHPGLLRRCLIATPHIAGYSADGKAAATRMSLQTLCRFLHRPFDLSVEPPALPPGYAYGTATSGPLRLYDPRVDSARLKAHPDQFEQLRGDYPLRREQ